MAPFHQLLELLGAHFPWLKPLAFWIGAFRLVMKCFSAPLQKFLTALLIEASVDNFDVYTLLNNRWYRITSFTLDYLLSFKLPSSQLTFIPATPSTSYVPITKLPLLFFLCSLLLISGCYTPSPTYSPVPPASTNTFHPNYNASSSSISVPVSALSAFSAVKSFPPPRTYYLAWDYPPATNIIFELWSTDKLSRAFSPWTNTTAHFLPLNTTAPSAFFILRASNTTTHLVSDFARQ